MISRQLGLSSVMLGLIALLGVVAPRSAAAQGGPPCDTQYGSCPPRAAGTSQSIDLTIMRPAIDSKGYITVNSSEVLRHLDFSFGLVANYGRNPLRFEGKGTDYRNNSTMGLPAGTLGAPTGGTVLDSTFNVTTVFTGQLQAAVGLFKFAELAVGIPFVVVGGRATPDDARSSTTTNDDVQYDWTQQGMGDIVVHLKARALNASRDAVGLGLVLTTSLPTADSDKWTGEGQIQLRPTLVIDKEWGRTGRFKTAINLGYLYRTNTRTFVDDGYAQAPVVNGATIVRPATTHDSAGNPLSITVGDEIMYGVGFSYGLVPDKIDLITEFFGSAGKRARTRPAEWDVGIRLYAARNSYLTVAGGYGVNDSYASPEGRIFIGIVFEPSIGDRDGDGLKDDVDKCPDDPEDFDDFEDEDGCPEPDNDKDGILDKDDKCPNVPETKNGFEDEDGCPDKVDLDRDGDGIPDSVDKCPDQPEDKDNFEDTDGCPDPDNDKDGILDVDDLCPNDPEDFDQFEDKDGCPDPDNDKDRILDKDDKCPNEPENYNGFQDEDGCPDKGRVIVRKGKLDILDKIYFKTDSDVILSKSFPILDAVAATIKGNPQIQLIEIQGHADERGDDDYNLDLSDRRVKSVRRYLVDKGVEANRLRARGYGETVPLCRKHNEKCWSKNRRVEFIIQKRSGDIPGAAEDADPAMGGDD